MRGEHGVHTHRSLWCAADDAYSRRRRRGLGHLAVQFLAAFGCDVTAISSTHAKDEEAYRLGARHFIATKNSDELQRSAGTFDFILSTVGADLPWGDYVNALRPQGRLVLVGVPESDIKFPPFPLLAEKSVSGGSCGGPSDTARMLDFAARTDVRPVVETFPMARSTRPSTTSGPVRPGTELFSRREVKRRLDDRI